MLLTVLSYGMIAIFMYVIMKKKLSPFTALVIIPLVFTLIAMATGVTSGNIGEFVLEGCNHNF
jgi:CitMHS family citrate-Mg2+:H+ or citrate-Ca2+:H+ symporter